MKDKSFELRFLTGSTGNYTAVLYNRIGGYYKELRFMWSSKKEIYKILRWDHDCIVRREAI